MKKVYLAGAMKGVKDHGTKQFRDAEIELRKVFGWNIYNPAHNIYSEINQYSYHQILHYDFERVLECDAIYMLDGWQESPGASCELALARIHNLEIYFENKDDDVAIVQHFKPNLIKGVK